MEYWIYLYKWGNIYVFLVKEIYCMKILKFCEVGEVNGVKCFKRCFGRVVLSVNIESYLIDGVKVKM